MKETREQYFEGILQLRNPNKELLDFIDKRMESVSKKGISVSKIKKLKDGMDMYFNNKKYIQKLGRELQSKFGGFLKISPTLFSRDRQSSKELYRVNVLLKLYDFKVNDVIKINNRYVKITSLDKRINGIDLELNKKKSFDYKDDYSILKKYTTTICKIKPNIEVLHPETYQSIAIWNRVKAKLGEKVKVVINGKAFIV